MPLTQLNALILLASGHMHAPLRHLTRFLPPLSHWLVLLLVRHEKKVGIFHLHTKTRVEGILSQLGERKDVWRDGFRVQSASTGSNEDKKVVAMGVIELGERKRERKMHV